MLELAQAIVNAARMYDESWNGLGHSISIYDASNASSTNEDIRWLVNILLLTAWTDALSWANSVLDR